MGERRRESLTPFVARIEAIDELRIGNWRLSRIIGDIF